MPPVWLEGPGAALPAAPAGPVAWLLDLGDPASRDRAAPPLPGEAAAYAGRADAGERLLRRRLARSLLAAAAGCRADAVRIARSPLGAPLVAAPAGWHLSLAARWPACLVAVARAPIGVDVEWAGYEPLPPDLLTPAERATGDAAPWRWAAKEAHAKWTGDPRRVDPAGVETAAPPLVSSPAGTTRCWLRPWRGWVAALCVA